MNVIDFTQLMQLSAAGLVVAALLVVYLINRSKDAAMAAVLQVSVNTMTDTYKIGVASLKESQEGQRLFYQAKVDDLFEELMSERQERKAETDKLQKRIADLECEVNEKDKRIETLEDVVENKDVRIEALEAEVKRLNGLMSSKQDKQKKAKTTNAAKK